MHKSDTNMCAAKVTLGGDIGNKKRGWPVEANVKFLLYFEVDRSAKSQVVEQASRRVQRVERERSYARTKNVLLYIQSRCNPCLSPATPRTDYARIWVFI